MRAMFTETPLSIPAGLSETMMCLCRPGARNSICIAIGNFSPPSVFTLDTVEPLTRFLRFSEQSYTSLSTPRCHSMITARKMDEFAILTLFIRSNALTQSTLCQQINQPTSSSQDLSRTLFSHLTSYGFTKTSTSSSSSNE